MTIAKGLQLTSVPLGAATGYFGLQRCCLVIYIITELLQKQQPSKAYGALYQTLKLAHLRMCSSADRFLPLFLFFPSPYSTSVFTGRMNHVEKPASVWQRWQWHIQRFSSAYDRLYQRVGCCNTHTYVSSITLMTFWSQVTQGLAVLASQMFFFWLW